jgi:hypothetical protein
LSSRADSCVVILSEASAPCFSSRIFATADAQSKDLLFVARPFNAREEQIPKCLKAHPRHSRHGLRFSRAKLPSSVTSEGRYPCDLPCL